MTLPFSLVDQRHYPTVDVATGYGEWAAMYDQMVGPELDLVLLAELTSVAWHRMEYALDLACGTGRIGAWLRTYGLARVDGVDLSAAMLKRARAKGVYERLLQADVTALPLLGSSYDLGTCVLAACHMPDLGALYRAARRALRRGGSFVLIDYHPFFLLNGIPTHFKRRSGEQLAIENYVHLLSDHVAAAQEVGWVLEELRERVVDEAWAGQQAAMSRYLHQPVSFAAVWTDR